MNTVNRKPHSIPNPLYAAITRLRHTRLFWVGLAVCFAVFLYVCIPFMLHWFMVVESPVHPADAVFIGTNLGSALDDVIDLQKNGMVKQIVVVYDEESWIEYEGKPAALHELTMQQLISRGVPLDSVQSVQWQAEDKIERLLLFRQWIHDNQIQSYLSFVSTYHSRYSKMAHDATFPEGDVEQVMMVSGSNRVWRKQILNLHNTMIRMFYWWWVTEPQLRMRIKEIS